MDAKIERELGWSDVNDLMDALEARIADLLVGSTALGRLPPSACEEARRICSAAVQGQRVDLSRASQEALTYLLATIGLVAVEMERGRVSRTMRPCAEPALALIARVIDLERD